LFRVFCYELPGDHTPHTPIILFVHDSRYDKQALSEPWGVAYWFYSFLS